MSENPKLTVNTFLAVMLKAKKEKPRIGKGKLLTALISTMSDATEAQFMPQFTQETGGTANRRLDNIAARLVNNETQYQNYIIKLTRFEKLCKEPKPSGSAYTAYLEKMHSFCKSHLDCEKLAALTYTLLELLRQDKQIITVFYNREHIRKEELFGTFAHPKRICLEALLVGLWYHVQMTTATENAASLELLPLPDKLPFQVFLLGDENEYIFRQKYSALEELLDLNIPIALEKCLQEHAKYPYAAGEFHTTRDLFTLDSAKQYSLKIRCEDGSIISSESLLKYTDKNTFIYGSGGMGKTTILLQKLQNTEGGTTCFLLPLCRYKQEFREAVLPDVSCWMLVQILLKYRYQYTYRTYDACASSEGDANLISQLNELEGLLRHQPEVWKPGYVLLLDGMNELPSELQDALVKELYWITQEWQNVRIIVTGRTVPQYELFDTFQHLEICGIPDDDRNAALSALPEYQKIKQNDQLLEILKTPLFLNMYLESRKSDDRAVLNTRGEILEAYVTGWAQSAAERSASGFDGKVIQFIVQYALPFAAKKALDCYDFEMDRADLSDAIELAYETYLANERIYQNYIAPLKIRKSALLQSKENSEFIELLLENICFLVASDSEKQKLSFTHQYFRDYFAAKHIFNLLEALETAYGDSHADEKAALFENLGLAEDWFSCEADYEIYRLIGEISGDYRNTPTPNGDFQYHRTILDRLLETYRQFNTFCAHEHDFTTQNIITTMSIARNGIICSVDFRGTTSLLPCNVKFSLDGQYPSQFQNSWIGGLNSYSEVVSYIACSPDGNAVLLGLDNNAVVLWDLQNEKALWDFYLYSYIGESYVKQAVFSPDGKCLTFLLADTAMLLDAAGNVIFRYTKPGYPTDGTVLFSDDSRLWFAHLRHSFILVDIETRQQIPMDAPEQYCSCLAAAAFSHDSNQLLIADENGTVTIWNSSGKLIHKHTFDDVIIQATFLPDDASCLLCTERNILLWDIKKDETAVLHTQSMDVLTLNATFSPDLQYCAVNCNDGSLRLVHISTGNSEILSHNPIEQIIFSPNSKFLLFTADDIQEMQFCAKEVVLYDILSGTSKTVERITHSYLNPELTAAFSSDSKHFILCISTEPMPLKFVQYAVSGEQTELNICIQSNHFKGCDFRGAEFLSALDKETLHRMGAIIDSDSVMPKFLEESLNTESLM